MNEPQVWTTIGVFATATFSLVGIVSGLFVHVLRVEIGGLRGEVKAEIGGLRGEVKAEIGGLRGEVKAEIAALRSDIAHLDRDVQGIARRVFPDVS